MLKFDQPDANWHARISFIKSALRIFAGANLVAGNLVISGVGFIVAEVLGIVEELV